MCNSIFIQKWQALAEDHAWEGMAVVHFVKQTGALQQMGLFNPPNNPPTSGDIVHYSVNCMVQLTNLNATVEASPVSNQLQ